MSENIRKLLNTAAAAANTNADGSTEINPHMPQYITKAPWYLNQSENSLNHQRAQIANNKLPISIHTQKGTTNKPVYKFRKGACENCGSMTHKSKECCERPRAVKAVFTGKDLCPDEFICEVPLDYEGKRDRWNGYDASNYKKFIYEYEKLEEAKKKLKEEEMQKIDDEKKKQKKLRDEDLDENVSSEDENRLLVPEAEAQDKKMHSEDIEKENENEKNETASAAASQTAEVFDEDDEIVKIYSEGISKKDDKKANHIKNLKELLYRTATSKSLHIGDDYSKYLLSLKENSAYYDPKSRSMRENPVPNSGLVFRGENALRQSGDALSLLEIESFIKEANQKNQQLNLNNVAMPTQAEKFYEYYKEKKENFKSDQLKKILDKYGGKEHLELPENIKKEFQPDEENEEKNEDEDQHVEHTSEFGSFFHERLGKGYKCCLSFDKDSSCGGMEGLQENYLIFKEYEKILKQEIENEQAIKKKKEEDLRLRNQRESANGVFTEMMNRIDGYERKEGVPAVSSIIVDKGKNATLLNNKRERKYDD